MKNPLKRVLIIDDDEINNFICIKNMKEIQFAEHVSYCLRADEGLRELTEALQHRPEDIPDVIFLDINMPSMNAWEFLQEYKKMVESFPKPVMLFILSSSVYRKDIERSVNHDTVSDYIIKPLTREILLQIKENYFH
ncbi:MAG: response regulator [Bacteroidota bacterium]